MCSDNTNSTFIFKKNDFFYLKKNNEKKTVCEIKQHFIYLDNLL